MSAGADFQNEPLGEIVAVGRIDPDAAQVWMRTHQPGRFIIRWWPEGEEDAAEEHPFEIPADNERDNTWAVRLPAAGGALRSLHRYHFRVTAAAGRLVGQGRFETAPRTAVDTPTRFSIGIMSCNQPFDDEGRVREKDQKMLLAARRCLEAHDAKFVLMMGDQMYSDLPVPLSLYNEDYFAEVAPPDRKRLLDCSADEVRRLYHHRYRHFWNLPGLRSIFDAFPCYPILDDHDILDNWGSDPIHKTPPWRSVGTGARWAYYDYQGTRVLSVRDELPPSFHYTIDYGHTAIFVMDLRSERRAGENGQLYSPDQEADVRAFLAGNRDRKILMFVLSVPAVHLPRLLARLAARVSSDGEDFSDRWSALAHIRDRDRFLRMIHEHQRRNPEQRIVLLSGDIHIGCAHKLRWEPNGQVLYQFISSGITNPASRLLQIGSHLLIRLNRSVATQDGDLQMAVRLLRGTRARRRNPFGGLNLGIVEIETPSPEAMPGMRFYLYGHKDEEPVCVYRSPLL